VIEKIKEWKGQNPKGTRVAVLAKEKRAVEEKGAVEVKR